MATKRFKCKVCGYIHEGDAAPEKCPVCQAPASEFEEITEGAAERFTLDEGQKEALTVLSREADRPAG